MVPKINMAGGAGGGGNIMVDLLTLLMSGKAAEMAGIQTGLEPGEEVKALRKAILGAMGKPGDLL